MAKLIFILLIFTALPSAFEFLPSWRIIGGKEAVEGQFPWQAQIRLRTFKGIKHHCGGSIITPQWILTSASCIINTYYKTLQVIVGSLRNDSNDNVYEVSHTVYHINYDKTRNDVALVKLSRSIESFGKNINKIDLETEDVDSINCTVAGWGVTKTEELSAVLRYIDTKTIPISECKRQLNQLHNISEKNHVCTSCATNEDSLRPTICTGDQGGPLVCEGKQVGIVSLTDSSCSTGTAVYTKVSNYIPWINNIMNRI